MPGRSLRTILIWPLVLICSGFLSITIYARENTVMGKVQFEADSSAVKTSGVWVDGQYVGFLHELKGSKTVLLLPGQHQIAVRQDGYRDFTQELSVQPGQTMTLRVHLDKATNAPLPGITAATVKTAIQPSRAAVFVDGYYVGHVKEFEGIRKGMLVTPGNHQITVALPGYNDFKTNINPQPGQTVQIKTQLVRSAAPLAAPLVDKSSATNTH